MSDDDNRKSRGPRKGGGAGGGKDGGRNGSGSRGGFAGKGRGPARPGGASGGERPAYRGRSGDDRPRPASPGSSERPARRFDKPGGSRDDAPRPPRAGGDRPFRGRPSNDDRSGRSGSSGGERPPRRFEDRGEPRNEAPRAPRPAGDRPFRARPETGERSASRPPRDDARPPRARSFGSRDAGDSKRFERPRGDRPERGDRPRSDRPRRDHTEQPEAPRSVILPAISQEPERIAKVMARAGVASRRDSEVMIAEGRVSVNGTVIESPALDVGPNDAILIDGEPMPARERTRMWLYHKPRGLVTTNHDPEGRPTVFDALPEDLPRVLSVGRLDINTEGLLLLTNDGGLARMLELPETGWLRRYRVRAFGSITQDRLDTLRDGVTIEGVSYGPVVARFERQQGSNTWLVVDLREGKNREVKTVLEHLGLDVNRLIRISFGPFQLADLAEGEADEIGSRVLKDQLGTELMARAGVDFEAPRRDEMPTAPKRAPSGDDRPKRRDGPRAPSQDTRSDKPWKRTVWRDAEAEPQRERKAPPRRGADPREERQTREATGQVERKRAAPIADPKGRRVLVERVSAPAREESPARERRPDRKPRNERGGAGERPPRAFERPGGGERPPRRPRDDVAGRDRADERPWREAAPRPERPARDGAERPARRFSERPGDDRPRGRSFSDKPAGKSFGERPAGRSGGGKPFGGKPSGGRPSGGRPFGDRPPGGGKPGGRGPRPGGGGRGKRD